LGSQNNDAIILSKEDCPALPDGVPPITFKSNNAGGVLGGLSSGMPVVFDVAFKPVPSIALEQETVNRRGESTGLKIEGRHDVFICRRALPVVEAMTAITLADLVLINRASRSLTS
jgi:chorismate synthase